MLVLVLAWVGVRWGEAIELRRSDVAEGCTAIRVRRAVTHRDGCRVDTPKSGKGRTVIVPRTSATIYRPTWTPTWAKTRPPNCSRRCMAAT